MNIRAIANSWASHIAGIDTRSVAVADYLERELRQLMGLSSLSDDNADQPAPTETGVRCGCNEFRADGTCVHKHPCPFVPNYRRVLSCAYTLAEALDSPGLSDEENADLTAAAKYVLSLGDVLASPAPTETGPKLDTSLMTEEGRRAWEAAPLADTAPQGAPMPNEAAHAAGFRAFFSAPQGAPCSECLASPGAPHVSTCKAHERW